MESSRAAPLAKRSTALVRGLCLVVLLLMIIAAVYGATMAIRYYSQIGV